MLIGRLLEHSVDFKVEGEEALLTLPCNQNYHSSYILIFNRDALISSGCLEHHQRKWEMRGSYHETSGEEGELLQREMQGKKSMKTFREQSLLG